MKDGRFWIVDADRQWFDFLELTLGEVDLKCAFAETPETLWERYSANEVEWLAIDAGLPGLGGIRLLRSLRALDEKIPIVVFYPGYLTFGEVPVVETSLTPSVLLNWGATAVLAKEQAPRALVPLLHHLRYRLAYCDG